MRLIEILTTFQLCWIAVLALSEDAMFLFRDIKPTQPKDRVSRRLPKYLMKLFDQRDKTLNNDVNIIRGIFPTKITRTKRAVKLTFNGEKLNTKDLWKKDELRLFLNKVRGAVSSSSRTYLLKIYDLYNYSKKPVNVYKLSRKVGWTTIEITGWRNLAANRIYNNKPVGLKLVVFLGKKKLRIADTPLRKSKAMREPYLVVFSLDKKRNSKINSHTTADKHRLETLPFARYSRFQQSKEK